MKKRIKRTKKAKQEATQLAEEPIVDDGYDGYYDDVLPPDMDREKEGLDKELIKKVALVGIAVFVIISMCVALLYVQIYMKYDHLAEPPNRKPKVTA